MFQPERTDLYFLPRFGFPQTHGKTLSILIDPQENHAPLEVGKGHEFFGEVLRSDPVELEFDARVLTIVQDGKEFLFGHAVYCPLGRCPVIQITCSAPSSPWTFSLALL